MKDITIGLGGLLLIFWGAWYAMPTLVNWLKKIYKTRSIIRKCKNFRILYFDKDDYPKDEFAANLKDLFSISEWNKKENSEEYTDELSCYSYFVANRFEKFCRMQMGTSVNTATLFYWFSDRGLFYTINSLYICGSDKILEFLDEDFWKKMNYCANKVEKYFDRILEEHCACLENFKDKYESVAQGLHNVQSINTTFRRVVKFQELLANMQSKTLEVLSRKLYTKINTKELNLLKEFTEKSITRDFPASSLKETFVSNLKKTHQQHQEKLENMVVEN